MSQRSFRSMRMRTLEEPTVNLTPLIDVVFVILIMFIVVAPLLELDRVELAYAAAAVQDKSISVQETSPIAIHVRQDNSIRINGQIIPFDQLVDTLKEMKKKYPRDRPQVFHDRKAHFGTYQSVKNATESAGFQQMDVILNPN